MSVRLDIRMAGHVCHDVWEDNYLLGGAVSYGGLMAAKLGHRSTILTSYGDDFLFEDLLKSNGVQLIRKVSENTTVYDNQEREKSGRQLLLSRADDVFIDTTFVNDCDILLLAPICDELIWSDDISNKGILTVGLLQGWLRYGKEIGLVRSKEISTRHLELLDIAFCSQTEYSTMSHEVKELIDDSIGHIVVTQGAKGARVKTLKGWQDFPAYAAIMSDPTGAGDVFSTSYAIAFHITQDISYAAQYASAAASLSIEQMGISGLPSNEAIITRMNRTN